MAAAVRERPSEAARAGRVDRRLVKAIGWSLFLHVLAVVAALVLALYAPAPTLLDLPAGGPMVDLVSPRGDSKVFKVGPLAKASGQKAVSTPEPPKPEPAKVEPPKSEPPKAEPTPEPPRPEPAKVEPKPEPPKVEPKPEPKPDAISEPKPEPPKLEPKPKPEPKKLEPKPEPKKPEAKKPEPKPEPKKPEPKKPEPKKPEPKKPEPKPEPKKPEPKADAKKPDSKPADAKPVLAQQDAGSSKPGAPSLGGGHEEKGGSSGDPAGGGGGTGARSPEFYAYYAYVYESIKAQWVWNGEQDATLAATVRFSILADGSITDVRLTERSRSAIYDESALGAVRATGSLTPPPPNVRADFEDMELVVRAGEMMQP